MRLIDADAITGRAFKLNFDHQIDERELYIVNRLLHEQPEAVVRCKDCRYYHPTYCEMWSKFGTIMTAENGFCYWGKAKQ